MIFRLWSSFPKNCVLTLVAWSLFCGSVSVLLFFHSWHHVSLWNLSPPCRWDPSCQQQPAEAEAAREHLKSFSLCLLRFPVPLPWPVTNPLLSRASSRARTPPAPAPWTSNPTLTTSLWKGWRSATSAPTATWSCTTRTRRDAGTASASTAFLLWGESTLLLCPRAPLVPFPKKTHPRLLEISSECHNNVTDPVRGCGSQWKGFVEPSDCVLSVLKVSLKTLPGAGEPQGSQHKETVDVSWYCCVRCCCGLSVCHCALQRNLLHWCLMVLVLVVCFCIIPLNLAEW